MSTQQTIKYRNGKERCKCGGEVMYGSEMRDKLPLGFGFVGNRFQIDAIQRKGFGGECMECGAKIFAVKSQRRVVSYPRGINARVRKARGH